MSAGVSLIVTERNEVVAVRELLDSALAQSLLPDEIVIADGGSTDGTVEVIEAYVAAGAPIELVRAPGNRSVGRNAAIEAASNDIIACTDVGCRLDPDWLREITAPLRRDPSAMAVAGSFEPEPRTYFERVSSTLVLAPNDEIDLATWLPSSRSIAFRKEAWRAVGGYPEHTSFNEDTPFALAMRAHGIRFEDGLRATVHWRPRERLLDFFLQYYLYAIGDALDHLHLRHFGVLLVKYAGLLGVLGWALVCRPRLALGVLVGWIGHTAWRVRRPWRKIGDARSLPLMVLLSVVYDTSQLAGYGRGLLHRRSLRGSARPVR